MLFSSLLALTALVASPVFAHFKLTNPPARGSDELTQDQGPCGGYNTPQTSRPDFKKGDLCVNSSPFIYNPVDNLILFELSRFQGFYSHG